MHGYKAASCTAHLLIVSYMLYREIYLLTNVFRGDILSSTIAKFASYKEILKSGSTATVFAHLYEGHSDRNRTTAITQGLN